VTDALHVHASALARLARGALQVHLPQVDKTTMVPTHITARSVLTVSDIVPQLSARFADAGAREPQTVRWQCSARPPSNLFLEFIPGRDTLYSPEELVAGKYALLTSPMSFIWSSCPIVAARVAALAAAPTYGLLACRADGV